jgi:hypothetical protein
MSWVPEKDWKCRRCSWKADPSIFTLDGSYSQHHFILIEDAAIQRCPRCDIIGTQQDV